LSIYEKGLQVTILSALPDTFFSVASSLHAKKTSFADFP
jgi:hypothetical protein